MGQWNLVYDRGGVFLPDLNLWLDPHEPKTGPERVFISHAHSDHVAPHREILLTPVTASLMRERGTTAALAHEVAFHQPCRFPDAAGTGEFEVTLLPAGHIFGSAMILLRYGDSSLLYTGDFKLRPGLSAEPCEPRHADVVIMETTFGRPQYIFPPTAEVIQGVLRFCREALQNEETPVLFGYSLGKSQEMLCALADAGLPVVLHGTVFKLTQVYQKFGRCFPAYEPYQPGTARGKVLLCPPNAANSSMLRKLAPTRTAVLTGWAVDPNCRYRYQCDAAFPLSDHADFPDLVDFVKRVRPEKIYTLHGFAAEFARTLRERGFDAQALSQDEQFALPLGDLAAARSRPAPQIAPELPVYPGSTDFERFAETCAAIARTAAKLEKIALLAAYLKTLNPDEAALVATWFSGRPFPASQNKVLSLGWAVLRDALAQAAGVDTAEFHQVYLKYSDTGETAAELLKTQTNAGITVLQIRDLFDALHAARGPSLKTPLLLRALSKLAPNEARYLVKIITGDLRIGLKEGLVEEAIASAYNQPADRVRQANLLVGDIGETARLASLDQLDRASLMPFRPVKLMLASPEATSQDIWDRLHDAVPPAQAAAPVWIEDKYDGIRCQLHRTGDRVALYSRDLKDVTQTFPELADAARDLTQDVILDGEIVAMRGDQVLPFAELQKRLGRREADLFMQEEIPIRFIAFDALWVAGQTWLQRPLKERRAALEALAPLPALFDLARITPASSVTEIDAAFAAARARKNEGLMVKAPESPYTPGRRGLAWLKLKKALATLDCVVIGAEYGHGKRSKVLSDYTFAVRDERTGELRTIGKAYTGLTDQEIEQLTEHFLSTAVRQRGRYFEVPPDTVLEIAFDKVQPSDRHNSGLALRFPRILRIRTDKPVSEIDTVQTARKLVSAH